ncbi:MAG: hypothetical protein NW201_01360 [Gemmatimonadales bacterium]|nr:hypothetical protein [Gemmatimonadales bacterium]
MIAHVQVATVLREAVAAPYTNLVTRSTGARVREQIEAVHAPESSHVTVLDFSEIALLDCSCADEIVAKLAFDAEGQARRLVVLRGLRDDQREAIEHVLVRRGAAVLKLDGCDAESVGELPLEALLLVAARLGGGEAMA